MYAPITKATAHVEAGRPKPSRAGGAPTQRSGLPRFIAATVQRAEVCACDGTCACADGRVGDAQQTDAAPTLVQRTPDSPESTPPARTEPAGEETADAGPTVKEGEGATAGETGTPPACAPTALSRADYLKQPGTSTNDFGLTSIAVSSAVVPRLETLNAPRGRGYVVRKTPDVMPPITSVYTKAGTFEEGEAHLLGDGDCPAGKYPIRWTISHSGADKIRDGEVEHCADYQLAWRNSMARYAVVVNDLATRGTTFANHAAAARHIQRIVGPHPDDWFSTYECLLRKSLIRDGGAGVGGWHKPRLVPSGGVMPPRLRDNCAFARAFISGSSLPEVGKHPSADIIKDCNEGPPAKKGAPAKAAPKSKAPAGTKSVGARILAYVGEPATTNDADSDYEPSDVGEELGWAFEIIEYGNYLNEHRDIEGMPTSGMKALDYARRRLAGERLVLPPNGDALLIIELLHVAPDADQQAAALALLEQLSTERLLAMISRDATTEPGRIGLWHLAGSFEGDMLMRVLDFLSLRFEGDFTGLLKDTGPLEPTDDAALDARTLDWLQNNRKSAERFFDEAWAAHAVVLLGETHHQGNRQRLFAADMLRKHGGPDVTLALETRHQAGVDAYLNDRNAAPLPEWFVPGEYHRLLDAARATGTIVDAVDVNLPSYDPRRDERMAGSVEAWQGIGSRVLFYGGALHIREARGHHEKPLGRLLAGGAAAGYAINMEFRDTATSGFFGMLRRRFPGTSSIGFDVDASPLRWRRDPDIHERTDLGENIDGSIYFLQRCGSGACACTACSGVRVSQPGDPEEREAETVARAIADDGATSAVPAMGSPRAAPHISNGGGPGAAGAPLPARLPVPVPGSVSVPVPQAVASPAPMASPLPSPAASGAPLDAGLRDFFEPRLGTDLAHVRVHTGADAAASARTFAARAYTLGRDVVFGAGEYRPDTAAGRTLIAHELVHVAQQRRGGARLASVQRQPSSSACDVRRPEQCATYEQWLFAFRSLPTFTSEDGVTIAQGGHPGRFTVLGDAPASRDPNAPVADRPPDPRGTRTADRFIDHPTDAWVRRNLPDNLRATAYQLPADCADILVILRHVYLSAHHRTERYGGWLVGDAQGEAAQRRIGGVIAEAATVNLERVVNPYLDAHGRPIRDFARLERLLHPGDQLVWDHHDDGLGRPRTGGHSQTIMEIHRASGGGITSIDVLQGNQPLFERQAREIIGELNRERTTAGRRPLPRAQTAPGGPLEMSLRHSPGRRIEVSTLEHDELQDVELPQRRGSSAPVTRVWTWGDAGNTILEVAGPPRSAPRPRMSGRGSARTPRISDWLGSLRSASAAALHGVFEGALHETRAVIDGGGAVSTSDATDLATTAGGRLWQLARRAVSRLVAFGRRRGDLGRGDLGDRAHFEPLYRIRAMIRALGGIEPPTYHGNPAEAADVRTTFVVIDREFDFAARGGDDLSFTRSVRRGGELVRVLITGFDPFDPSVSGPPAAGEWNPSGAAALSLDGTEVALGGRDVAAVEGVVLPVSFAQFRGGIVERAVRAAGADVDAVLSVSLDPNLATTDPVRIEQFAVGVHNEADIQPHRLVATETVAHPGLRAVTPGGPPIVESNIDVTAVAAETLGRERRGLPSVLHPTVGRDITLRFASAADAGRAATALGAGAAAGQNLVLSDEAVVRAVMTSARPVSSAPGANAEITFLAGSTRFRATLVRGPGGSFLSNEVFYRVRSEIARTGADTVSFHVHTPGAAAIPQATGTRAERSARGSALGTARDAVVTLVATLRRLVGSVGRRVAAARRSGGTP